MTDTHDALLERILLGVDGTRHEAAAAIRKLRAQLDASRAGMLHSSEIDRITDEGILRLMAERDEAQAKVAEKDAVNNRLRTSWREDCAALEKERNQYRIALVVTGEERDSLRSENEALRQDAERLDWIQAGLTLHNGMDFLYVVDGYEVEISINDRFTGVHHHGETQRAAIDAARGGKTP